MKPTSILGAPYRTRSIVRTPGATDSMDGAALSRAIALTQLVLSAWCVARVEADLQRGSLGLEGTLALLLLAVLIVSLAAKCFRRLSLRGPHA